VLFASNRDGPFRIYKQDLDQDTAELITHNPVRKMVPGCRPTASGCSIGTSLLEIHKHG
jgi:hypothetical protein